MPANIPREAQERMINYNFILEKRYAPQMDYFKLSAGYIKSDEAINDLTPLYIIYTTAEDLDIGSTINVDQNKSITYDGGNLWYHVFNKASEDLQYVIKINANGIISNKIITA